MNQETAANVRDLLKGLDKASPGGIPQELDKLRKAVLKLQPPEALVTEVSAGVLHAGIKLIFAAVW